LYFSRAPSARRLAPRKLHSRNWRLAVEPKANDQGEEHVHNELRALRGPGESYRDVILRLVEIEAEGEL
jgi:hypothetical protein